MDNNVIRSILSNIGFSKWEIDAYLILVKYGGKTALELSRLSGVARPKTYEVVSRLRVKGLVMKVPPMPAKGITQKFVAMEPKKVFESKISEIENLSKNLSEMYNNPINSSYPKVNYYTSREAFKELFSDVVKKSRFLYFYLTGISIKSLSGYNWDNYLNIINHKKNHFLLLDNKEMKDFSKSLKNFSFSKEINGMSYIICSDRIILDLWSSQHFFIEIISDEAVKTFILMYNKLR